jgi:hypothetical protein
MHDIISFTLEIASMAIGLALVSERLIGGIIPTNRPLEKLPFQQIFARKDLWEPDWSIPEAENIGLQPRFDSKRASLASYAGTGAWHRFFQTMDEMGE